MKKRRLGEAFTICDSKLSQRPMIFFPNDEVSQEFGGQLSLEFSEAMIASWQGFDIYSNTSSDDIKSFFQIYESNEFVNLTTKRSDTSSTPDIHIYQDNVFEFPVLSSVRSEYRISCVIDLGDRTSYLRIRCYSDSIDVPIVLTEEEVENWATFRQGLERRDYSVTSMVDIRDSRNFTLSVSLNEPSKTRRGIDGDSRRGLLGTLFDALADASRSR